MQVYQPEFEEPWALGLVSQHDPVSHIMEITMDQVTSPLPHTYTTSCTLDMVKSLSLGSSWNKPDVLCLLLKFFRMFSDCVIEVSSDVVIGRGDSGSGPSGHTRDAR